MIVKTVPVIYRFVCPDGRSYVGHANGQYARTRKNDGIGNRSNKRLSEALRTHRPNTWTYEVLEELPPGCSKQTMLEAEQRHIERLHTNLPEHGFNCRPAVYKPLPLRPKKFPASFHFIAPASLVKKIEDWRRREPGMPNQSAAIRRLLEMALEAVKKGGKHGH